MVYIVGSLYCKVLKDGGGGALPLWLFLDEGSAFLKHDGPFLLFSIKFIPPSSSYCSLYCRRRDSACDHWCCLKVLLNSLKFHSGCRNYCPDAVHFSNVAYCDHFARFVVASTFFLSVLLLFWLLLLLSFAKSFWKALLHSLSPHNLARSDVYISVYKKYIRQVFQNGYLFFL